MKKKYIIIIIIIKPNHHPHLLVDHGGHGASVVADELRQRRLVLAGKLAQHESVVGKDLRVDFGLERRGKGCEKEAKNNGKDGNKRR